MASPNKHIDTARIQSEILKKLSLSPDNAIFDYSEQGDVVKLNLITVNPRHNQSFLYHTTRGVDKPDALQKMLDYVKSSRESENTYTVQWMARSDRELHTSYFRAKNMYEALDKLYYDRDINTITVYSCVLNPVA